MCTCVKEILQVCMKLLGGGGVQVEGGRLQLHLQGLPHSHLHALRQALQVAVQEPEHRLLPLIRGRLQRMPEVAHLQAHSRQSTVLLQRVITPASSQKQLEAETVTKFRGHASSRA